MSDYNLGTARGRIEVDAKGAVRGAAEADKAIAGIGGSSGAKVRGNLLKVAGVAGAASAAIGAGFAYAINKASDFEHSLSAIQAVSGGTQKQMDAIRGKALQLGKDTVFSAGEAASSIEELAKNGLTLGQIMHGAADATVNLAAAGQLDLASAAEISSAAMNHFNLAAKDLPHVADLLAASAARSAVDVGDLGESMKYVGPVANTVGASLDDTVLALTAFGKFGIKGSMAGTTLRQMLLSLTPQSKAAGDEMKKLGIITKDGGNAFYDAHGKLKSMADISQVLRDSMHGLSKEQQTAALHTIFGSRAIAGATVLAGQGAKGMDKLAKSMKGLTAADQAKTRMDNLQGSVEQLKGSLETAGIQLGTILIPIVRKVVDAITGLINKFLDLSPSTQKIIIIVAAVVAAFTGLLAIVITIMVTVAAMGAAVAAAGGTLMGVVGTAALVSAGIIALIVVLVLVIKYHHQIMAVVKTVWGAVKGFVLGVVNALVSGVTAAWNAIVNAIMTAVNAVIGFVQQHWQLIMIIMFGVLGLIVSEIIKHFDTVKKIFQVAWTVIKDIVLVAIGLVLLIIQQMLRPIVAAIKLAMSVIQVVWKAAWNAIKSVVQAVWHAISPFIKGAIDGIRSAIKAALNGIEKAWHATWNAVKAAVQAVWHVISPFVHAEVRGIIAVIHTLEAIVGFIKGVFTSVYNAIVGAFKRVLGWLDNIKDKVLAPFKGAAEWLKNVGVNIIQGLWNGMKSIIGKVGSWLSQQVKHLKHLATHPWEILSPSKYMFRVGQYIMQGLALGLIADAPKADKAMRDSMSSMGLGAKKEAGLIMDGVKEAYKTGGVKAATTIATTLKHISIVQGKELKTLSDSYQRWVKKDLHKALTGSADGVQSAFDKINEMIKKLAAQRSEAAKALKEANKKVADAQKALNTAENQKVHGKGQQAAKDDSVAAAQKALRQAQRMQVQAASDLEFAKANSKIASQMHAQAQVAERALTKIAHEREQLAAQIQTATQALQAAQQAYDQYASEIAGKITDTGALTNVLNQTDAEGNAIATTAQGIIDNLQAAVDAANSFKDQLDALRKAGLSEDLINQIAEAGPDQGSQLASAILAGGAEAIKELNTLNDQLTATAQAIGKSQADAMYGAGVLAAQGFLKGLQDQEAALLAEAQAIADAITATIKKALKMKSPSRVMMDLGVNTVAGFVQGFASQISKAESQASRLAQVAVASTPALTAASVGVSAARAVGGDGASMGGDTYHVGDVIIPASDIAEMQSVADFFGRIKQEARRGR
jgi:TP901 family phage tail tape measure protein